MNTTKTKRQLTVFINHFIRGLFDPVLAIHSWKTAHSLYLLDIEKPKKSAKPYQIPSNLQESTPEFLPSLFSSTNPLDKITFLNSQCW